MQIGVMQLVSGVVAMFLMVGGAFMVGTKWTGKSEANTASVSEAFEDDAATSSEEKASEGSGSEDVLYDVVKVIDGDTITIKIDGKSETIRLIGLDTPETSDPRVGVQCFGKEATAKLKSIIGDRVSIEKDAGEGERDKYDRLLAYVYNEEETLLNKYMIAQGYAYEYTYDDPYKYQKQFKAAEAEAKAAKRGLWAPNACPEPVQAAPAPKPVVPAPEPTKTLQPETAPEPEKKEEPKPKEEPKKAESKPEPEPEEADASSYTCSSNKYNCSHFKTQSEAQAVFEQCGGVDNDVHKLDGNKDGQVCESLP